MSYLSDSVETFPAGEQDTVVGVREEKDESSEQLRDVLGVVRACLTAEGMQDRHGCAAQVRVLILARSQELIHDGTETEIIHYGQHHCLAVLKLLKNEK